MAANNTKSSLESIFKRTLANDINMLVPNNALMLKLYPSIQKELGREYIEPVALTLEHGVTYGDGDAFSLNDSVAGVYGEAQVTSNPVILKSRISQAAANRMLQDDKTFLKFMGFRTKVMKESLVKRAEIAMRYGQSSIGTVDSASDVSASDVGSVVITAATWCPMIWGGMEGCPIQFYNGSSLIANAVVTTIDPDTRTVAFSGTEADLDNIAQGHKIFFKGSKSNDMSGLDTIVSNSGTLFNISASTYNLWKSNSHSVTGALTFGKILKAAGKAVAKGGLDNDAICTVPPPAFEQLNEDYAAYRSSDSSYKAGKGQNGVETLDFHYQGGRIQILPDPYLKQGESFIWPKEDLIRVGARDISFGTDFDAKGEALEYFHMLESVAGYEMRCQYDFSVFLRSPAKAVKISGITYS